MTFLSQEQIIAFNLWKGIYNLTYKGNKCIINQLKCDVKQTTKQSSLPYKNNSGNTSVFGSIGQMDNQEIKKQDITSDPCAMHLPFRIEAKPV